MASFMTTLIGGLFVCAVVVSVWLLARFIRQLQRSGSASRPQLEALSQLLISGSGGVRVQLEALAYLLQRKYATLGDKSSVSAGNRAFVAFWVAAFFMALLAISMLVSP